MLRGKDHQRSPTTAASFSPTKPSPPVVQEEVWEVRPSGMLVQKRTPDSDPPPGGAPVPTIRVKVKFAGVTHEVYVNSQASFGELKKLMAEKTGRHPDDLKVVYKDKERDAKEFLDMVGVKDRSRVALLEDPEAQARRLIEERKNNKERKAALAVNRVSLQVDELAAKVAAMAGKVVGEAEVVALTEALMNELVKLDAVAGDGDVRAQRRVQEKRVQKLVETLDGIRAKAKSSVGGAKARQPHLPPRPTPPPARASQQHQQRRQFQPAAPTTATAPKPQTATASWDSFDLLSSAPPPPSSAPVTAMAPAVSASPSPRFEWELF